MRKEHDFANAEFAVRADALCFREDGGAWRQAAPWFEHVGRGAKGDGSNVSQIVRFFDDRGDEQEVVVPMTEIELHKTKFYERLIDKGYPARGDDFVLDAVRAYVIRASASPAVDIRLVDCGGWQDGNFVLGKDIISPKAHVGVRLIGPIADHAGKFGSSGTLPDWQRDVASRCLYSNRLICALGFAFGAPLLDIVGIEGGGINFVGRRGIGKTTCLNVAGGVYGGGITGYVESWDMTDNAPGTLSLVHNDLPLCLDELDELDPDTKQGAKRLRTITQRLSNSRKRSTSYKAQGANIREQTKTLFLGSSERSVPQFMRDGGVTPTGGQISRFTDVPADAGANLGILDSLPRGWNQDDYLREINRAVERKYGVPGKIYSTKLVHHRDADEQRLKSLIDRDIQEVVVEARRIAPITVDIRIIRRFGIACAGLRRALAYGVLPSNFPTLKPVIAVLKAALTLNADAQTAMAKDPGYLASQVVRFLEADGNYVIRSDRGDHINGMAEYDKVDALIRVNHNGRRMVWMKSHTFHKIFQDYRRAAAVLSRAQVLIPTSDDRWASQERVPNLGQYRDMFYRLDHQRLLSLARIKPRSSERLSPELMQRLRTLVSRLPQHSR